jgi:hypothetical protein
LKSDSAIEREILSYLAAHPGAQDTLRGIIEWWLLKQRIADSKAAVEAAVASLVAQGKLREHIGIDRQVRYGLSSKDSGRKPKKRVHSKK